MYEKTLTIRSPTVDDLPELVELVRRCEPFLTAYIPYFYWVYVRYFGASCAVAEVDGVLAGWCAILPVPSGSWFLHQLGVAPELRKTGIGKDLVIHLVRELKSENTSFELEFTVEKKNRGTLILAQSAARAVQMHIVKRPDVIDLLQDGYTEELYVLTANAGAVAAADTGLGGDCLTWQQESFLRSGFEKC